MLNPEEITGEEILAIWGTELWPDREDIRVASSMTLERTYDMSVYNSTPKFFGIRDVDKIVGVNSAHPIQEGWRSRGLWVHPEYRLRGYGIALLDAATGAAAEAGSPYIWSYPSWDAWRTYTAARYTQYAEWEAGEHSEYNCYAMRTI